MEILKTKHNVIHEFFMLFSITIILFLIGKTTKVWQPKVAGILVGCTKTFLINGLMVILIVNLLRKTDRQTATAKH